MPKNVVLDIPINKTIRPVCQPYRRIPIPLEAKIDTKIKELIKADIIKRISEPSAWFSPMVRIDMRRANQAIIRENHPLPTLKELIPKFRKAQYFSKLNIKDAFHQVELTK